MIDTIRVRGISGSARATEIDTAEFAITDSDRVMHSIKLDKVI